jgi:hypothetical protein
MKASILKATFLSALLFSLHGLPTAAQEPGSGYWVVETNVKTKDHSVVKFYDTTNQLVYEERLEGVHLNINRPRTVKMLNQTLRGVIAKSLVRAQLGTIGEPVAFPPVRKRG